MVILAYKRLSVVICVDNHGYLCGHCAHPVVTGGTWGELEGNTNASDEPGWFAARVEDDGGKVMIVGASTRKHPKCDGPIEWACASYNREDAVKIAIFVQRMSIAEADRGFQEYMTSALVTEVPLHSCAAKCITHPNCLAAEANERPRSCDPHPGMVLLVLSSVSR